MTAAGGSHLPAASLLASSRQRGAQEDFHAADYPLVFPQSTLIRQSGPSHPTSHHSTFGGAMPPLPFLH